MTPTQLDEEVLRNYVIDATHGDTEAIGALYDALYDRLYTYVYRRTLDQSAAQDIVANSFYKVLTNIQRFAWKHPAGFYGWVFRIVSNEIATYYRQANGYVLQEDWLQIPDSRDDEEVNVHNKMQVDEEYKHLHTCVTGLPDKYRSVIELYYFAGLSHAEIAATLSIKEGAARVRLHRGIEALHQTMRGE